MLRETFVQSRAFSPYPATDLRNNNPEINATDQKDSLLSRKEIEEVALGWTGEWLLSDPGVSLGLELLKRANIKVDGVIAGYDILAPDAIDFRKKLEECGVKGDWLGWEKQMQFLLMFPCHVREGIDAKDWTVDILRSNIQRDE